MGLRAFGANKGSRKAGRLRAPKAWEALPPGGETPRRQLTEGDLRRLPINGEINSSGPGDWHRAFVLKASEERTKVPGEPSLRGTPPKNAD